MRRHRFDALSFVSGLVFLIVAALYVADRLAVPLTNLRWVGAGALLAVGVGLLVGARGRGRHDDPEDA